MRRYGALWPIPVLLTALLASGVADAQRPLPRPSVLPEFSATSRHEAADAPFQVAQQVAQSSTEQPQPITTTQAQLTIPRDYTTLYSLDDLGSIRAYRTPSLGRLHVHGEFAVSSADYFRGLYDGVKEIKDFDDAEEVHLAPMVSVTLELFDSPGWLSNLNLVGGSSNSLAQRPAGAGSNHYWYESNNYVGLLGAVRRDWLAGFTYTAYGSPNGEFDSFDELSLALQWAGDIKPGWKLNPHVKAAWPVGTEEVYVEGGLAPQVNIGQVLHTAPVTLALPVVVGVGVNDYYQNNTDPTGYVDVGLKAGLSMKRLIPAVYGNWDISLGVHGLFREADLVNASRQRFPGFDNGDKTVVYGTFALGFTY